MPRSRVLKCNAILQKTKRLSATDISALASMKNVAKCDTWCELQNPVNHRVFERKLRPKPLGRGHVCLGVSHRVAPNLIPMGILVWERKLVSRAHCCVVGLNKSGRERASQQVVVVKPLRCCCALLFSPSTPLTLMHCVSNASTATPGQAGLPAEFKHINKRRRRNLQGFP